MRQVKKPKPFSSYMDLMCDILEKEPTFFEEAIQKKEWEDAMIEEYQSIIKNDVWEMVLDMRYILFTSHTFRWYVLYYLQESGIYYILPQETCHILRIK
jgi:hypothetical protein